MPRNYTRKTRWGLTPIEEMKRAVSDVKGGKSIRSVAKERNIDRSTLRRYIKKSEEKEVKMTGYMGTAEANRIFPLELEKELADHIKKLSEQFHGLTQKKCRELASELAERNNIPTPSNWTEKGLAGKDWFKSFMSRHHLSIRMPEATSLGRATAFNRTTVGEFFDNLANVMDRHKFPPNMIYNVDETGVTTVQSPKQVVAEKGKKQVGAITSAERGELVTVVCAINATDRALKQMSPGAVRCHIRLTCTVINTVTRWKGFGSEIFRRVASGRFSHFFLMLSRVCAVACRPARGSLFIPFNVSSGRDHVKGRRRRLELADRCSTIIEDSNCTRWNC
ncbi:uncharacterized protein AKAME5_002635800 [Lates japonicus]|uniref:HTH CENPB-type domain-containing protein n=1 Tax=Lates japonicus TaxID=270547 RepID=A0AAD3NMB0_LATJO|nr:uncharacterized protein AKAME5_002635800 [Lates japonicus]